MKSFVVVVLALLLSACSITSKPQPPVKTAWEKSDTELCQAVGVYEVQGDLSNLYESMSVLKSRIDAYKLKITENDCDLETYISAQIELDKRNHE